MMFAMPFILQTKATGESHLREIKNKSELKCDISVEGKRKDTRIPVSLNRISFVSISIKIVWL